MVDKDKLLRDSKSFIEKTDDKMFRLYSEALVKGDSLTAKLYLNYVMEFCPDRLKN